MSVLVAFINCFSYGYVLLWCLLHRLRSLFLLFRNRIYTLLYNRATLFKFDLYESVFRFGKDTINNFNVKENRVEI